MNTLFDSENQQKKRITKFLKLAILQILLTIILWWFKENAQENRIFLTIDTILPVSDPLRIRKKLTNQAQYYLDRLAAKISA